MKNFNFDNTIDRHSTQCIKYDCLEQNFGRNDLFPLWIADMDFPVCPDIVNALKKRYEHPVLGYTAAPDSYWQSIINWVDHRHGLKIERSELTFVNGVVRGIGFAINFFTRPGDKIVIQPPVYHPFRLVPEGNGRVVIENPLIETKDSSSSFYAMDLEGLETIFANEQPRMMILCNPHNPAGIQWSADVLASVARLAKRYNVIVISDEIHSDLMLDGIRHIPFLSSCPEAEEVSITFGAPSKTFNIAGLESSWMLIRNPKLREPFFKWMEVNEFSSPSFTAWTGAEAAYTYGEQWLDEMLKYIEANADAVEEFCSRNIPSIKPIRPEASFLSWLDCRSLNLSQEELIKLFTDKAKLALNDGCMFGSQGTGFMRLNLGLPRKQLIEAFESLADAINTL